MPFGALEAPDRTYLADRYAIEMLAGIDSRAAPAQPANGSALRVLGFGVTQAVGGFEPLPGMADELCYVVHGPITGLMTHSAACSGTAAGDGALPGEGFADPRSPANGSRVRCKRLIPIRCCT